MEDLTRKWCTLLSQDEAFMTPVIGYPPAKYMGLFSPNAPADAVARLATFPGCPRQQSLLCSERRVEVHDGRSNDHFLSGLGFGPCLRYAT